MDAGEVARQRPAMLAELETLLLAEIAARLAAAWERGWRILFDTIESLEPSDLDTIVTIRGEPHTTRQAFLRALAHAAYHIGQITYLVRMIRPESRWLTIPPGEPGAVDEVGVTVIPPPHRARVTVTFSGVVVEDADALGGRLALRLAVGDQATRWPEEGAADVQDGKRFELDQRFFSCPSLDYLMAEFGKHLGRVSPDQKVVFDQQDRQRFRRRGGNFGNTGGAGTARYPHGTPTGLDHPHVPLDRLPLYSKPVITLLKG